MKQTLVIGYSKLKAKECGDKMKLILYMHSIEDYHHDCQNSEKVTNYMKLTRINLEGLSTIYRITEN